MKEQERQPELKHTDQIYSDDGRKSDGKDHKGDWGNHSKADRVEVSKVIKSKKTK